MIPIDEPLSASRHTGSPDSKPPKQQFRPFGRGDNNTLEKAWSGLASDHSRKQHLLTRISQSENSSADEYKKQRQKHIRMLVGKLAQRHLEQHGGGRGVHGHEGEGLPKTAPNFPICCSSLHRDIMEMLQEEFCSLSRKYRPELAVETLTQDVLQAMRNRESSNSDQTVKDHHTSPPQTTGNQREHVDAFPSSIVHIGVKDLEDNNIRSRSSSTATIGSGGPRRSARLPPTGVGISGKPFVRVEDAVTSSTSPLQDETKLSRTLQNNKDRGPGCRHDASRSEAHVACAPENVKGDDKTVIDTVVGVSRLHKVSLPMLHMKPIYWSPVNDVAVVMRATWFYRDTMMPVAPPVANQLEAGYQELQPWTQTWGDELRCAIEIGPAGEEKISHCLWPQDSKHFHTWPSSDPEPKISSDPFCAARCFRGDAATQGTLISKDTGLPPSSERTNRAFTNYHVIYKDEREAFLLKPTLKPSAYYGRRPTSKIVKGLTVGIPVVRGFDRCAWDRRNGQKHGAKETAFREPSLVDSTRDPLQSESCDGCRANTDSGQVTDLILVAHGIGQKIAERVESYHFTHAINGFRRAVNVEMSNSAVQRVSRQGQKDVMILPLNWRMGLSFEEVTAAEEEGLTESRQESFGLKDIEPNTIPAIRSMISDVMFDIPFYMSHHKSKMIKALISEANRVYRLWCQNNHGFSSEGRVHLIAHSLGSVMAVDILSRQPTKAPSMDLSRPEPESRFLEFDTTNLFLLGSPAGFFLLLEQGALTPRRGRRKPGADARDVMDKDIVRDAGRFGCLAVDNIYNVLAKEDPIAYLLNGTVDPAYAAVLKTAFVPSTSVSMFKSMGDAVRKIVPGLSPSPDALTMEPERPPSLRLPSQLELEVHDFTREEIAEKRAFLLNDNGQIDWFLKSGGGPLEIQYLNMLSAHTSYWINQDFIRMLCVEIARQPGRAYTLPAMRAVKATKRFSLET